MMNDLYDHEQLIILAVMLSWGSVEKKAETLFNHMDHECTKNIKAEQYRRVLGLMIKVWLGYNAKLGIGVKEAGFADVN